MQFNRATCPASRREAGADRAPGPGVCTELAAGPETTAAKQTENHRHPVAHEQDNSVQKYLPAVRYSGLI